MRDKINGVSNVMGEMSAMMKQMSERMEMGTKKIQRVYWLVMFFSEVSRDYGECERRK